MVRHEVVPHSTSPSELRQQRAIYSRNRTPVRDARGRFEALDVAPANSRTTGQHLGEVHRRFGEAGLAQSVHGLGITRGWSFADAAVRESPAHTQRSRGAGVVAGNVGEEPEGQIVGGRAGPVVSAAVDRSGHGRSLPGSVDQSLRASTGADFSNVRVHDDDAAHRAARLLGARAFTVGQSIYFGKGEYQPTTPEGSRLLAHEAAHTLQNGSGSGAVDQMEVSDPSSAEEREAARFADGVTAGLHVGSPDHRPQARIMRQVTFTHANDNVVPQNPATAETAATFQIAQGAGGAPHFQWSTDVTIHGNAGDPFANFQVGPQQIVRAFHLNVFWGTGANRSHLTSSVPVPIRDTTPGGTDWYHDAFASAAFAADGDVRSTRLEDTPGVTNLPFANPVAGRVSTRGWFNWGMAFVAYMTARDTTVAGAAGFRTLASVYWNLSVAGDFDTARPVNGRVRVSSGGATNVGGVIEGPPGDFPPIHGGTVFNAASNANLVLS